MSQLTTFLDQHLIQALGWTFVHTLWQGCIIVLAMIFALQRIPHKQAVKRYTVATASMLAMLIAAAATFSFLYFQPGQSEVVMAASRPAVTVATESAGLSFVGWLSDHLDAMVAIWAIGVALLSLRLFVGMVFIYRLKQTSSDLTYSLGAKARQIAHSLKYSRAVIIAESALVKIPVVVGYLKPVILFPIGAVNQLSADEVEAVLAHEIAHLVRNDFIHNLIQSVIEIIFYYHPAVWWISAVVRSERENCCDDLAIQVCGNSFTYARALVRLQEVGSRSPALALPFAGSKNHLLQRVKRILNQPQNKSNLMEKITATSLLLICMILASFNEGASEVDRQRIDVTKLVAQYNTSLKFTAPHDTIKPLMVQIMEYTDADGETIHVEIENGEVKALKVDGEEIPGELFAQYEDKIDKLRRNMQNVPPPPAPHTPPMPPSPTMAPMPPMPPMPPTPSAVPLPPAPPALQDFGGSDYNFEFEFEPGDFQWNPEGLEFDEDMEVIVKIAPHAIAPDGGVTRSESIIIRERNSDGSVNYRVEGEHSTIEIDNAAGVAIINGQEVLIDSDSIIVIEETKTTPGHNYGFFAPAPDVQWNSEHMMKELKTWDAEKWAEEWKSNWNNEEWDTYWKENKEMWLEYSKQMEENMQQYKQSPEWKRYMEQMDEYRELLKENGDQRVIFIEKEGDGNEFIIRSQQQSDKTGEEKDQLFEYRVIREEDVLRKNNDDKKSDLEKDKGHSSVLKPVPYQYVIQRNDLEFATSDAITVEHTARVVQDNNVMIKAKVADLAGEGKTLRLTGDVVMEIPEEEGGKVGEVRNYNVILVTDESLTVDGQLLNEEQLRKHNIEIKLHEISPADTESSVAGKKAKF